MTDSKNPSSSSSSPPSNFLNNTGNFVNSLWRRAPWHRQESGSTQVGTKGRSDRSGSGIMQQTGTGAKVDRSNWEDSANRDTVTRIASVLGRTPLRGVLRRAFGLFERVEGERWQCHGCRGSGVLTRRKGAGEAEGAAKGAMDVSRSPACWLCLGIGTLPVAELEGYMIAWAPSLLSRMDSASEVGARRKPGFLHLHLGKYPGAKTHFTTSRGLSRILVTSCRPPLPANAPPSSLPLPSASSASSSFRRSISSQGASAPSATSADTSAMTAAAAAAAAAEARAAARSGISPSALPGGASSATPGQAQKSLALEDEDYAFTMGSSSTSADNPSTRKGRSSSGDHRNLFRKRSSSSRSRSRSPSPSPPSPGELARKRTPLPLDSSNRPTSPMRRRQATGAVRDVTEEAKGNGNRNGEFFGLDGRRDFGVGIGEVDNGGSGGERRGRSREREAGRTRNSRDGKAKDADSREGSGRRKALVFGTAVEGSQTGDLPNQTQSFNSDQSSSRSLSPRKRTMFGGPNVRPDSFGSRVEEEGTTSGGQGPTSPARRFSSPPRATTRNPNGASEFERGEEPTTSLDGVDIRAGANSSPTRGRSPRRERNRVREKAQKDAGEKSMRRQLSPVRRSPQRTQQRFSDGTGEDAPDGQSITPIIDNSLLFPQTPLDEGRRKRTMREKDVPRENDASSGTKRGFFK
eukprot:TRINITY_DN32613_c0_g1_i1.p1 TRINITY_DN32613_c0_g1~~TRINITY_DN32613_c0_g1_i1.p1  ORF type:complete len:691 (-),score=89.25 TRINITY_DN32613_c0_g1_i1:223-2295(-)